MYTQFKEANELIQKNLDVIIKKVRETVPGLKTMILAGGHGRGEGAVEVLNKKPRLINDFDIYLITKKQLSDDFLEKLGKECAKLINKGGLEYQEAYDSGSEAYNKKFNFEEFFSVDFRNIPYNRLRFLPPMIRYYEMKNSTTIIYGQDIRNLIPNIRPEDIPTSEGIRMLSNRMMALFLSMKPEYLKKEPAKDERGLINYYISKAYLSCCEALLVLAKQFKASYRERADIFPEVYKKKFPELYNRFPELIEKVKMATDYKLNPEVRKIDYIKEWFTARYYITEIFKYIISLETKTKINSWVDLSEVITKKLSENYFEDYASFMLKKFFLNFGFLRYLLKKSAAGILSMIYFVRLRDNLKRTYWNAFSLKDPGLKILSLTHLVLLGLNADGSLNKEYDNYFLTSAKSIFPVKRDNSWNDFKKSYLDLYKLYYLGKFI